MNIGALKNIYERKIIKENSDEPVDMDPSSTEAPASDKIDPKEQELIDDLEIKIATGKLNLHKKAPELSRILARLNIRIVNSKDPHVDTMAVDNFGNVYINPGFAKQLNDDEFYGVFAHEALHIANGTFLRKKDRDHHLWNIATDSLMNWALLRDGFKLPAKAILPDVNSGEYIFKKEDGTTIGQIKVIDDKGYALSAEQVYDQLQQIKNKMKQNGQGQKSKGKPGQGQPGQGQPGQSQPGDGMSAEEKEAAAEEFFKKADNKTDKHLTNEEAKAVNKDVEDVLTPEQMKEMERRRIDDLKRGNIDKPSTQSNVSRGTGVGGIRDVTLRSIPIVVDWKNVIRRYLKSADSRRTTWMQPSYRGLAGGYQAPGKTQNANKLEAVFAIDTSGSVGDEELGIAFKYIKEIAHSVQNINVRICLWHSETYYISPPVTSKGALDGTLRAMNIHSGGTTMSSIDPFLKAHKVNPIVVIYVTDGYTENDPKFGSYQKLFVIVNNQVNNPEVRRGVEDRFKKYGEVVITPTLA